jgi:hypothetical protein
VKQWFWVRVMLIRAGVAPELVGATEEHMLAVGHAPSKDPAQKFVPPKIKVGDTLGSADLRFVAVLPDTDLPGALTLAERIRQAVEALPPYGSDERSVSVSIGIGVYEPGTAQTLADLMARADEALYAAKALGRNHFFSYELQVTAKDHLAQR